jgi:hypothetical protein
LAHLVESGKAKIHARYKTLCVWLAICRQTSHLPGFRAAPVDIFEPLGDFRIADWGGMQHPVRDKTNRKPQGKAQYKAKETYHH